MWAVKGSIQSGFIALHGEAGFEPRSCAAASTCSFPSPIESTNPTSLPSDRVKIAYVFARDGASLGASQALAANDTEDKSTFRMRGNFLRERWPERPAAQGLRAGTYAINTTQFAVITDERVYGHALSQQEQGVLDDMTQTIADRDGFAPVILAAGQDLVGIVTVHDGPLAAPR